MALPINRRTRQMAVMVSLGLSLSSIAVAQAQDANSLLIVDCLLPGRVQQLGNAATYVTARRAIKTSAANCRARGGEYTKSGESTSASLMRIWMPLATGGDTEAQTNLGEILEKGVGGQPQPDLAVQWYQLAADKGYARAQVNLGAMYERGVGVARDPVKAMEWYRRASGLKDLNLNAASTEEMTRLREERDALSRQLEAEKRKREQLETELGTINRQLSGQRSSLQVQQRQFDEAQRELAARNQALDEQRARMAAKPAQGPDPLAAQRLTQLQRQLDEQRRTVTERDSQLQLLQGSVQQLESRSNSLQGQLAASERQRAADLANARDEASAARQELAAVTERLRMANDELGNRLATIDRQRASVEQLRQELAARQNKVSSANADQAALQARLRQQEAELVESRRQLGLLNTQIARLGQQAETATPARQSSGTAPRIRPNLTDEVNFGRYYALVIGNNNYRVIPKLRTAVNDAQAVAEVLRRRYGFQTTVLLNANRYQLLSALNTLRERLTSQDNLLIYYAGHGALDEDNSRGFWLPVDAEPNSTTNWIASYQITDVLKATSAKQIFLVADSCYSGMLTRSAITRLSTGMTDDERQRWYRAMATKHARVALTSGGVQPVLDGGGGGRHSVFASAFIQALEQNSEVLEGQRLAQTVTQRVAISVAASQVQQVPLYAPLSYAGHEAGDFFFVPK